jgi:hypothetical protein
LIWRQTDRRSRLRPNQARAESGDLNRGRPGDDVRQRHAVDAPVLQLLEKGLHGCVVLISCRPREHYTRVSQIFNGTTGAFSISNERAALQSFGVEKNVPETNRNLRSNMKIFGRELVARTELVIEMRIRVFFCAKSLRWQFSL